MSKWLVLACHAAGAVQGRGTRRSVAARETPEAALKRKFKKKGLACPKKQRGWKGVTYECLTTP